MSHNIMANHSMSKADDVSIDDCWVGGEDNAATALWNMCTSTALEMAKRNLVFEVGLPRRQTLLLDDDPAVLTTYDACKP